MRPPLYKKERRNLLYRTRTRATGAQATPFIPRRSHHAVHTCSRTDRVSRRILAFIQHSDECANSIQPNFRIQTAVSPPPFTPPLTPPLEPLTAPSLTHPLTQRLTPHAMHVASRHTALSPTHTPPLHPTRLHSTPPAVTPPGNSSSRRAPLS